MKLRKLREASGLSQDALARRARITREYVNKLEAGQYDPTVKTLTRLAKALSVPVTRLMPGQLTGGGRIAEECALCRHGAELLARNFRDEEEWDRSAPAIMLALQQHKGELRDHGDAVDAVLRELEIKNLSWRREDGRAGH